LHKDLCTVVILSRYILLIMKNMLDKSYRENENTFYVHWLPPPEERAVYKKMQKKNIYIYIYRQGGHLRHYNTAHAHFMLVNEGYRHTFIICNNYCFSTPTVVMQTRQIVTSCVSCLSCSFRYRYQNQLQHEFPQTPSYHCGFYRNFTSISFAYFPKV
jgi:hypothetical protein